jgi:hypothetical protein
MRIDVPILPEFACGGNTKLEEEVVAEEESGTEESIGAVR